MAKDETIEMQFDGDKYKKYDVDKYGKNYSEDGFFKKITGCVKKAGIRRYSFFTWHKIPMYQ